MERTLLFALLPLALAAAPLCTAASGGDGGEDAPEAPVPAEEIAAYPAGEWTEVAESGGLGGVLDAFAAKTLPEWPAVHSAGFPATEKTRACEAEYRALAIRLLARMEKFEARMRGEPDAKFLAHAEKMLLLRDGFAKHCAYVNLVLADAIDRCVCVDLAARLVRCTGVPDGLAAVQEHLARFRPSTQALAAMVAEELGLAELPDGLANATTDEERLAALWELLEPGVPVGWPGSTTIVDSVPLLETQGLLALLARLVSSDTLIHTHLPSLILYRRADPDPPARPTYREIKAVLGTDTPAPESLGRQAYGIDRTASAASEVYADLESGQLRERLLFSTLWKPEAEKPKGGKAYTDYPEWKLLDKIWFCDLMDEDELAARESLIAEGEAACEAMMAVVRECDNLCIVSCALSVLIESQGDKRAVVAELKKLFAQRLPDAEDEWEIYYMANAIAEMGGEEDSEVLIPMLKHPGWIVRVNGARFLGRIGGAKALEALKEARQQAQDRNPTEREAVEQAIAAVEKRLAEKGE